MNTHFPPLFVSHGSPMIALEPGEAGAFMQRLGRTLDAVWGRPKAVLAISAHTTAREAVLLGTDRHEAVYDFGGFRRRSISCVTTRRVTGHWRRCLARRSRCRWSTMAAWTMASGPRCATSIRTRMCP
ncbi:hypothetical protein ACFJIX_30830 [Roseateles sp. UC29_93]|uniref:hypothetical protein n=1 Tax=Roseateles sp. UC29_93 TaxID=3350177 RepID=UPI00366EB035